jgi:hypothetical protein
VSGIVSRTEIDGITAARIEGFFAGWPSPPPLDHRLRILPGSSHVVTA